MIRQGGQADEGDGLVFDLADFDEEPISLRDDGSSPSRRRLAPWSNMRPGCAGPTPGARKASPQKASPRPRKASPRKASHQKVQEVPPPGLKLAPQIEASAKPAAPSEGSSGASAGALEDTKLGGEVSS